MLVLTRKLNEQIKIGDDVTITVIKLRNNQIRLGIEAPRDVRVLRAELEAKVTADTDSQSATAAKSRTAADSATGSESEAVGTNRVRTVLNMPAGSDANAGEDDSQRPTRNDVVDGLVSADEMIAAGRENDGENTDGDGEPPIHEDSPQPALQVFSGKISSDGTVRENVPSRKIASRSRAPLAGYFTAP